jgi:hypothetical protein
MLKVVILKVVMLSAVMLCYCSMWQKALCAEFHYAEYRGANLADAKSYN